jgi:hypothetical protein
MTRQFLANPFLAGPARRKVAQAGYNGLWSVVWIVATAVALRLPSEGEASMALAVVMGVMATMRFALAASFAYEALHQDRRAVAALAGPALPVVAMLLATTLAR